MCDKCNKKSCNGCSNSSSTERLAATIAQLQDELDTVTAGVKAFLCGNPILLIENADNIAMFDSDGLGSQCWESWAICNGKSYINPVTKKSFTTPNFVDRFIVQATGLYAVGDVGGEAEHVLTIPELPAHTHGVTDPGHTHDITDPGHLHATSDSGHTHAASGGPHNHTVSLSGGGHTHTYQNFDAGTNYKFADVAIGIETGSNSAENVGGDGAHSHSGTTDNSASSVAVTEAFTGVAVENAFIGITETEVHASDITIVNEGGGLAHNNLPPYYAAIYVVKMW